MLTMGVDIGSTACKCVILENGTEIVAKAVVPLGTGTKGVNEVVEMALKFANVQRSELSLVYVTGYGRFNFSEADGQRSELSCHAKGMKFMVPDVRTIVDIGGQDVKVLSLAPNGQMTNFIMNDKCAAGTGRFLDVMAGILDKKTSELGDIDAKAKEVASISSTCTVFAESEVISKLSANVPLPDLVAGIHASVAKRVAGLVFRAGVVQKVAMSGGVALNKGVVRALEKEIHSEIIILDDCQIIGALGAALYAYHEIMKPKNKE